MTAPRLPKALIPVVQTAIQHGWTVAINPDGDDITVRLTRGAIVGVFRLTPSDDDPTPEPAFTAGDLHALLTTEPRTTP